MSVQFNVDVLFEAARDAQERAHVPYSDFPVGAAILTRSGDVYSACNVETKPSANTLHAEQRAVAKAVEDGHESFIGLALVTNQDSPLPPCGNCRQSLATFQEDLTVVVDMEEGYEEYDLRDLLPNAYTGRSVSDAPTEG